MADILILGSDHQPPSDIRSATSRNVQCSMNLGYVRAEIKLLAVVIFCKQKTEVSQIHSKEFQKDYSISMGNEWTVVDLLFPFAAEFKHVCMPHMITLTQTVKKLGVAHVKLSILFVAPRL
ncbi:unnamed protein product [Prunus armeniaca]